MHTVFRLNVVLVNFLLFCFLYLDALGARLVHVGAKTGIFHAHKLPALVALLVTTIFIQA